MRSIYKVLLGVLPFLFGMEGFAQTTVSTTSQFSNNNGSGIVTFNLQNSNASGVIITEVKALKVPSGAVVAEIWYKPTPINGVPGTISTANGWTLIDTATLNGTPNSTTPQTFFSNLNFTIPANTTYGFAVYAPSQGYYTMPASPATVTFTAGGVSLIAGANVSYGGGSPGPSGSAPTFTPRGWVGEITFIPALPCTSPPTAGTTTVSAANVCAGGPVTVGLSGNSFGTGQTYQLLTASTAGGPYTTAGTAQSNNTFVVSPVASTFYRIRVMCGTGVDTSSPVQVTVPALFAGGTYTINNGQPTAGTNFNTFSDAVAAISCGISGPVIFNVSNNATPYNEQFILPNIATTSATNTVTFNGNNALLNFSSSNSNQRAAITLDGADWIRVNNLRIAANGTYGFGVQLTNDADHNIVRACTVTLDTTSTSSFFAGLVMSGSLTSATTAGSQCDSNQFLNNTIHGGYYAITSLGNSTSSFTTGNIIRGNTLRNPYYYGVYNLYNEGIVVDSNDLSRPTRTNSGFFYALYNSTTVGAQLSRNRIHNLFGGNLSSTSTIYGVYITGDAPASQPNMVVNNAIFDMNGDGAQYLMYNSSADNVHYYHNTLASDEITSTTSNLTRGFYQITAASGIELKNNIFSLSRGGSGDKYGVYFGTSTTSYSARSNVYYVPNPGAGGVAYYIGTTYPALAAYQAASQQDTGSVSSNPVFASAGGQSVAAYTPTSPSVNNIGTPVPSVTSDILGNARSTTAPDPGAIEFTPTPCTTPPIGGVVTASDTVICAGNAINFDLLGNSYGLGQTYQWQASPMAAGPYTNVGTSSSLSSYNQAVTNTTYFRVAVTCGTSTSFSDTQLVTVIQPLGGGAYTINAGAPASATNFQTFATAVQAMQCGVVGPVVINVVAGSGPYNEQVVFPSTLAGTSSTNTITINGNGNSLVFNSTNSNERAGILIDGADWIRINNLNITATGTYGFGVQLTNDADNNIISNCTVTLDTTSTSSFFAGLVMSGSLTSATTSGSQCDSNQFLNNTVHGGYYGITSLGTSGTPTTGNVIRGNIVRNPYYYGIYNLYNDGILIDSNSLSRPTRTNSGFFYGVYISTNIGATISRNRIHNLFGGNSTSTSTIYGLYVTGDATVFQPNTFVNNLIYDMNGQGAQYLIYNSGSDYARYWHNTIASDDSTATGSGLTRGIYQTTTASGIDIRNNIFSLRRTGSGVKHALYFNTAASTITSNYNDLIVSGGTGTNNIGYAGGSSYTTLPSWQQNNPYDTASVSINPMFAGGAAGTNMTPTNVAIDNLGQSIGVAQDAFGAPRSLTTPDLGAIEWSFIPPCAAPTALTEVAAATSASISWTGSTSTNVGYEYQVNATSAMPTGPGFPAVGSPVNVGNLTASTTYYWFVRTVCGPNSYSPWVGDSFTTCTPPASTLIAMGSTTPNSVSVCQGDSAILKAPGGAANTYLFLLNGATVGTGTTSDSMFYATQGGSYRVVVTNATGCFDTSAPVQVTVNPLPTPVITQVSYNQLTTGTFTSYQWNLAGQPVNGATSQTFTTATDGNYTVTVTDANGCRATSNDYSLTTASVGGTAGTAASIRVFPNPTTGVLFIESAEEVRAQLWTIDGRKLMDTEKAQSIDLRSFATGVYVLRVMNAEGTLLLTERVTKAD